MGVEELKETLKELYFDMDNLPVISRKNLFKKMFGGLIEYIQVADNLDLSKYGEYKELQEFLLYKRKGPSFFKARLKGLGIPRLELKNIEIDRCDFENADFKGTNLSEAQIKWSSFRNVNFADVSLYATSFDTVDLRGIKGLEKTKDLESSKFHDCLVDQNALEIICNAYKNKFSVETKPSDAEIKIEKENAATYKCHDCDIKKGEIHNYGCDMEICPFCKRQLISCSCIAKKLAMKSKDYRLKDATEKQQKDFLKLLTEKGRIPYIRK